MRPRGYGSPIRKEVQVTPVELKLPAAHPRQHEFITYLDNHPECRFVIGAIGSKWGKLVHINTTIPTLNGWTTIEHIKEGDFIFGIDGKPSKVEYITDVITPKNSYRMTFSDGNFVDCCGDHLWEVKSHLCRKALERKDRPIKNSSHAAEVLTTEQIKENLYYESAGKSRPNYTIDLCQPVEWPEQDLPIDPYLFGVFLGDGSRGTATITCDDKEQSVIDNIRALGYTIIQYSDLQQFGVEGLRGQLKQAGLLNKDYIPECYKIGSVEQRLSLLQGLMDTDGTVDKHTGYCTFDNTNKLIADLVAYLAQSLGIKVQRAGRWGKLNGVKKKWCYRVYFKTDKPVFRMQRKLQHINKVEMTVKSTRRTIVSIESIDPIPMRCIRVDNPRHLFLVTDAFIPTHNTLGCCMAILKHAWTHRQHLCWWVAPTYSQAENAFNIICKMLPKDTANIKKGDLKIEILRPDGKIQSVIEFKSGEKSGNLRGFAVNFFVLDEAALIDYDAYVSVMTTLTNTKGRGIIISTPKGRGWFYDVYKYGEKYDQETGKYKYSKSNPDPYPEYISFRLPTADNPFNTEEAIALLKRDLPEDSFRQEILAEFLTESAGVFKGIRSCISGELEPPKAGINYIMGADLARINDYTVLTVVNDKNHVVFFERFNKVDWSMQLEYIKSKAKLYNNALVVIDSTGVGDAPTESLMKAGVRVKPFKIGNNNTKKQLIDRLRIAIEQKKISYPAIPNLISELEAYEYSITDGGVIRYSAPSGKHDDCVISLALANFYGSAAPFIYKAHSIPGI